MNRHIRFEYASKNELGTDVESHEYTPGDMAEIFTEAERANLAAGKIITRPSGRFTSAATVVDLEAFFVANRKA